jgi:DNA transposition AAA+ family ATPase
MTQTDDTSGPQTEHVRHEVVQAIKGRGLTQSAVARQSGVSAASLSQFLNGTYQGDSEAIAAKLTKWLAALAKRKTLPLHLLKAHDFVETTASRKIVAALEYAQFAPDFAVVIGEPGAGKTATLKHVQRWGSNVWLATMSPDTSGQVPMLQELGLAMGLALTGGAATMRRQLAAKVSKTGGLIVVDEAQHLDTKAVETLRGIHDATEVGLVLCGNPKLVQTIGRLDQVYSRMGRKVVVGKPTKADVSAVADQFGVSGRDDVCFLAGLARRPGGLRSVVKTLRLAMMNSNGEGITHDTLTHAWSELALEDAA